MLGRSRLADTLPQPANVVVSNVPGAPVPLYFAGARLRTYYPVSIAVHGMALNVTVHSYDGQLDFGLIACRRAVPDLGDLADYLVAEYRLLRDLSLPAVHPPANAGATARPVSPAAVAPVATTSRKGTKRPRSAPRSLPPPATVPTAQSRPVRPRKSRAAAI